MDADVETAVLQWEEGGRRLESAGADQASQRRLRRAVAEVEARLRRQLGSSFSVAELAELYRRGTDWCLETVLALSRPDEPPLDPGLVTDAAFCLYMREASDFAGGRVIERG